MRKVFFGIPVCLCLVAGAAYAYQFYQWHYLSSDLQRILLACLDTENTGGDIHSYFHEARLDVRTRRDAVVFEKAEHAFSLFADAKEIDSNLNNESDLPEEVAVKRVSQEVTNNVDSLRAAGFEPTEEIKKELRRRLIEAANAAHAAIERQYRATLAGRKQRDKDITQARQLLHEVSIDLGRPKDYLNK